MSEKKEEQLDPARAERSGDGVDAREPASGVETERQVLEIRHSIEQTRTDMSETIDELQERLRPSHLKEQLKEQVAEQYEHAKETVRDATIGRVEDMVERASDAVYEARRSIVDTISANPVPSALLGIGLAWLWINGRSDTARNRRGYPPRHADERRYSETPARYGRTSGIDEYGRGDTWDREASGGRSAARAAGEAVRESAGHVQERASHLAGQARDKAAGMIDQAQETAGYLVGQAQYQAERVEERFEVALRESPLAVGAIALALGTAIGLAVPQTRKENEWMGDTRDALMDSAEAVAHDAVDQVQHAAEQVADKVAEGANQSSREHGGR